MILAHFWASKMDICSPTEDFVFFLGQRLGRESSANTKKCPYLGRLATYKKIKALCFLQLWKLKKTKCLYFFDWRPDSRDTAILLHYLASARARSPSPKPKRRAISLTLSPASFIPKIFPLHITWRYHIMICQAFSIGLRSGEFPGQSIHLKGRLHTKIRNSRIN